MHNSLPLSCQTVGVWPHGTTPSHNTPPMAPSKCPSSFQTSDGLTSAQHTNLVQHMKDLLLIDPEDLLEEDRALLYEDSCEL